MNIMILFAAVFKNFVAVIEALILTKKTINKIQVVQRAMERGMSGISIREKVPNQEMRRRTGTMDTVERISTLKWNGAGHFTRISDNRWTLPET